MFPRQSHPRSDRSRDAFLIAMGAVAMLVISAVFPLSLLRVFSTVVDALSPSGLYIPSLRETLHGKIYGVSGSLSAESPVLWPSSDSTLSHELPSTSVIVHTPGWTLFRNLYMSNGTLFLISPNASNASFPEVRMMTSTGLPGNPSPGSVAEREPTKYDMDVMSLEEAKYRWGVKTAVGHRNRVATLTGNTLLLNDPDQFLRHYYHFVAELFLGVWTVWAGVFGSRWHDGPGFNAYFLHAIFPSLSVEVMSDWQDRVRATQASDRLGESQSLAKAWHFPVALLVDRSAAFRGEITGAQTQRTAAGPWEYMVSRQNIDLVGSWWNTLRVLFLEFMGDYDDITELDSWSLNHDSAKDYPSRGEGGNHLPTLHLPTLSLDAIQAAQVEASNSLPIPDKIVLTYISRQGSPRRHLVSAHHDQLVSAMQDLVARKGASWELNVIQAENLVKDEQVKIAARTTIMIGVHGNGLTHLLWMRPSRASAVIEIFWPGGFARDYEWTANALGINHYSVWNDTIRTRPNKPSVSYPDGFQSTIIPVHGPAVAELIERHVRESMGGAVQQA